MRIAYIATGAAGMVCGTCIHDNTIAAAIQKSGHDIALIPTYTPIKTDEENVSVDRVFLGGLNVYLQEKIGLFRHTPVFIDNLLNSKAVLNWISRFSASTNARQLGKMTVSMLRGEEGNQRKEIEKLVRWLKDEYKPDIVHLNHSLIVGFAREIKQELSIPVICGAQGEDLFLEGLIEPYKTQAKELIREKIQDVDALIVTSDYYADFMSQYLQLSREKIHKVYLGITLDGYGLMERRDQRPLVIGYFARICPEKGFHLLVDAFHKLWLKHGAGSIRLHAAGYLGKKDEPYFKEQVQKMQQWGIHDAFDYAGEVDRLGKLAFLSSVDIFALPTVYRESKGLSVLEAMANGLPVVVPNHGNFPEYIEKSGGGILCEPESVDSLVQSLDQLISDRELRVKYGKAGHDCVHREFSAAKMAQSTVEVYEEFVQQTRNISEAALDSPKSIVS